MTAAPTDVETRVLDAVDEAAAVDLLRRTIAVPSVGGTDAECDVQHAGLDVGQHGGHGPESGTPSCQAPARDSGHEAQ